MSDAAWIVGDARLGVRRMCPDEVALAVEWAAAEGWNPGLHDAECFRAADPDGFFICEVDGLPVGSVSAVRYGESFGFIGLFVVLPQFRGHRAGILLKDAAIAHLKGRNIGLDGVMAKVRNYEHLGVRLAYRNFRYEGVGGGSGLASAQGGIVLPLTEAAFEDLAAYDCRFFPAPRDAFLREWIAQPGVETAGVVRDGKLCGCAVMRRCLRGRKIGPLFADSPADAEALFSALEARAPGEPVILDIPETNPAALDLARYHGMKMVFETARMYSRGEPAIETAGVFGVTTFELG